MTVSIAKIENNTIVNIIVGSDNWERMFSRSHGWQPLSELSGIPVIGAVRVKGNEFMPPEYLTEPPLTK